MFSQKVPHPFDELAKQMEAKFTTPNSLNATTLEEYVAGTLTAMGVKPMGEQGHVWAQATFWDNIPPLFFQEISEIVSILGLVVTDEDDEDFEDEAMDEFIESIVTLYAVYG